MDDKNRKPTEFSNNNSAVKLLEELSKEAKLDEEKVNSSIKEKQISKKDKNSKSPSSKALEIIAKFANPKAAVLAELDDLMQEPLVSETSESIDDDEDFEAPDEEQPRFTHPDKKSTSLLHPSSLPPSEKKDTGSHLAIEKIFPRFKDRGLTYVVFFILIQLQKEEDVDFDFENPMESIQQQLHIEQVIRLFKTRRDFPQHLRTRIREYLIYLPKFVESAPIQEHDTKTAHFEAARYVKQFIQKLEHQNLFMEFWRNMNTDFQIAQENSRVYEYGLSEIASEPEDSFEEPATEKTETVKWLDEKTILKKGNESEDQPYKSYMSKILENSSAIKPKLKLENEEIFDTLLSKFPNFAEVISFYRSQFRLNKLSGKEQLTPVLLLGEPGIGKTHFAQTFARLLKTGYSFIDIASTTDAWVISGLHASWKGGKPGKVFQAMVASPTASPIILLDELEKAPKGHHDSTTPLYQMLEETNAREFTDEFVDFPADLSRIIYIACANSLDGLSEPLQSRFKVFDVPSPTSEQQASILQFIYEEETASTNLFAPTLSEELFDILCHQSIRESKVKLVEAIGKAILEYSHEEIQEMLAHGHTINLQLHHFKIVKKIDRKIGF